ncbi:MAG TPA: hypothetical protein VFR98_01320 [Agromyces sp.]|nr:hypothetical protein [Agromyces sp.]
MPSILPYRDDGGMNHPRIRGLEMPVPPGSSAAQPAQLATGRRQARDAGSAGMPRGETGGSGMWAVLEDGNMSAHIPRRRVRGDIRRRDRTAVEGPASADFRASRRRDPSVTKLALVSAHL